MKESIGRSPPLKARAWITPARTSSTVLKEVARRIGVYVSNLDLDLDEEGEDDEKEEGEGLIDSGSALGPEEEEDDDNDGR